MSNILRRFTAMPVTKQLLVIFTILFSGLFLLKWFELRDYNIRQGRVIAMDPVVRVERGRYGAPGGYYALRTTPIIEYYSQRDTIVYNEGKRTMLSYLTLNDSVFYTTGEKIRILELKNDPEKVKPLTFFHYWLRMHECFIIFISAYIILGICRLWAYRHP